MNVRSSRRRSAVVAVVVSGAITFGPMASAGESTDPQGDTVNDDTDQPMDVAEADIVRSWISADARAIVLGLQVRTPTDPATHRAWVDGDSSAEWDLDVNGDSEADFVAAMSNEDGQVVGGVSKADAAEEDDDLCSVSNLSYAADRGYTVTVDAACIGSPDTVAYQAEFFYDTDPSDENAPEATDSSPDDDMSPASSG